jgi:hypothetical protein
VFRARCDRCGRRGYVGAIAGVGLDVVSVYADGRGAEEAEAARSFFVAGRDQFEVEFGRLRAVGGEAGDEGAD